MSEPCIRVSKWGLKRLPDRPTNQPKSDLPAMLVLVAATQIEGNYEHQPK